MTEVEPDFPREFTARPIQDFQNPKTHHDFFRSALFYNKKYP